MENICIYRRIDELGRIMLPRELREKAQWKSGDCITITYEDETHTLTLRLHSNYLSQKHNVFGMAE